MLVAKELIGQLNMIHTLICQHYEKKKQELSKVDTEIQEILHQIEFGVFNVVKGYNYSKRIKVLRMKRRVVKGEFESIQALWSVTQNSKNEISKIMKRINVKDADLNKLLNTTNSLNLNINCDVNNQDEIKACESGSLA